MGIRSANGHDPSANLSVCRWVESADGLEQNHPLFPFSKEINFPWVWHVVHQEILMCNLACNSISWPSIKLWRQENCLEFLSWRTLISSYCSSVFIAHLHLEGTTFILKKMNCFCKVSQIILFWHIAIWNCYIFSLACKVAVSNSQFASWNYVSICFKWYYVLIFFNHLWSCGFLLHKRIMAIVSFELKL